MPRFGLATLNHSTLHGLPTQWAAHLDGAAAAGFDALAPDVFWLRSLAEEGVSLAKLDAELKARGLACMEIAGIAIGSEAQTRAELEENLRYAEALGAEFVNARIVEEIDEAVTARVADCARAFAEVGTCVALEFSRGTRMKGVAGGRALIEAAGVAGVGVTLDTWHFFLDPEGPDWSALEALPLDQLANVQLSDGVAYPEGGFGEATMNGRRLPGEGGFDLARCAQTLAAKGFGAHGAVVVEVLNADLRALTPEVFAARTLDASRRWWQDSVPDESA